jgi:hypothetical protein
MVLSKIDKPCFMPPILWLCNLPVITVAVKQLYGLPTTVIRTRQVNGLKPAITTSSRTHLSKNVDFEKRGVMQMQRKGTHYL